MRNDLRQVVAGQPPRPLRVWKRLSPGVVVAVAAIGAYANTLANGFVSWDDERYITKNPLVTSAGGLRAIWADAFRVTPRNQFYPLVFSTFWLEHQLVGDLPTLYHATQVLLHAANAVLLLMILNRLAGRGQPELRGH